MAGIPVSVDDYRALARHRLPRFLFDYLDGGAGAEQTLAANAAAWARLALRQRVLVDVAEVDTACSLFGEACAQPLVLAPVGLAGLMARRGEVQAVRAAHAAGVPFTLSTVGLCGLDEVAAAARAPFWFQLYWLRDRGLVQALLARAQTAGCRTLVFTVDLPVPGLRHRDPRNGLGVPGRQARRIKAAQVLARPGWIWRVALRGRPLRLGSLEAHAPAARDLDAFRAFIDAQFDPRVTWADLAWLRERWPGRLVLKGILDADDARAAVAAGADGIVVSNHGGRQLDGVLSTAKALPEIAQAVGSDLTVLVDSGVRSGLDVVRMLALGARGVLLGRAPAYALAADGQRGVENLLEIFAKEMRVAMTLTGVTSIAQIDESILVRGQL